MQIYVNEKSVIVSNNLEGYHIVFPAPPKYTIKENDSKSGKITVHRYILKKKFLFELQVINYPTNLIKSKLKYYNFIKLVKRVLWRFIASQK